MSPLKCLFCDKLSWQQRKGDKIRIYKDHCSSGVCCSICKGFSCDICLKLIVTKIKASNTNINDSWYYNIKSYLEDNTELPPDFVGHCCEIKSIVKNNKHKSCLTHHLPRRSKEPPGSICREPQLRHHYRRHRT